MVNNFIGDKMKTYDLIKKTAYVATISLMLIACGPLNPVNDFFGIQMNPSDEANFVIVNYTDIDGISYKNSINMNPKINAWAEFSSNEITLKVTNNSSNDIPLNYTSDQFILITDDGQFMLSKGERAEYFKKGMISANTSASFQLELPMDHSNISNIGGTYVDQTKTTKEVLRNYSRTEGRINILKDNIKYFVVKFGDIAIVLKRVPESN